MEKEKLIAMYLPQFHQIPENDRWWGEGYTDWNAVKAGCPLFEGHNQPRKPKDGYYYDLMDKSTMQWQSNLMKEYRVDGMCFYHYYFEDGRRILEKPAENLLKWKDIDMPYCFCWANESWARTWSKIGNKNAWVGKLEKAYEKGRDGDGILLAQKYGREDVWKRHFEYLAPFFKDDRYIRTNGAPVFLIYKPEEIYCLPQMLDYWRRLAVEYEISAPYFIGLNSLMPKKGLDAVLINAPTMYFHPDQKGKNLKPLYKNGLKMYQYEDIWNEILSSRQIGESKTFFGGLTNSDGTPRHGKNVVVVNNFSIEKFRVYLYRLMEKNRLAGNEFTFINAWNEWGEGAYLEPDEEYGFQYLEAVRDAKERMEETAEANVYVSKQVMENYTGEREQPHVLNRDKFIIKCLDRWISLKEEGICLASYFRQYHYNRVAVYGIGILGRHLICELEQGGIEIAYIIDRRESAYYPGIKVKRPECILERVDAIIVTAADYDNIYEKLQAKVQYPIISILEVVSELL